MIDKVIVLASSSPRRKQIISSIGWKFRIAKVNVEEKNLANPIDTVMVNAQVKLAAIKTISEDEIGLAADTIVAIGNRIMGKPRNRLEAKNMLKLLSGRKHTVITGFSIGFSNGRVISDYEKTYVQIKRLALDEIDWYVSTNEPMDKAGAYAVQGKGSILVDGIEGDFFNVMGLPIGRIYDILKLNL